MSIYGLFLGSGQLNLWTPMPLPLVIQSRSNSSAWLAWKILKQIKFLCLTSLKDFEAIACHGSMPGSMYFSTQTDKVTPICCFIMWYMIDKWVSPYTVSHWVTLCLTKSPFVLLSHLVFLWVTLYLTESPCITFGSPCISLSHPVSHWVILYLFEPPCLSQSHPVKKYKSDIPYFHMAMVSLRSHFTENWCDNFRLFCIFMKWVFLISTSSYVHMYVCMMNHSFRQLDSSKDLFLQNNM